MPEGTIWRILDTARFAPSGGNRQAWRVILLQEPAVRSAIRHLYLGGWYEYLAISGAGLVPFAPLTDRQAEAEAMAGAPDLAAAGARSEPVVPGPSGSFAENLDQVPVLLLLLADLRLLAAVDRDLDRYTFAGGASIYPFAWQILLAARLEGLGGVLTTMPIRREAEVRELVGAPDDLAVAGLLALGHPRRAIRRLRRAPVEEFATVDRIDGRLLAPD